MSNNMLEILTAQLDAEKGSMTELFQKLGLLYVVNTTAETNVDYHTGDLNIDQVLHQQPTIWRGRQVEQTTKKKKIIISDVDYLLFMELYRTKKFTIRQTKEDTIHEIEFKNTDLALKLQFKIEFQFAVWQILLQHDFELYLWDNSPGCLLKPVSTYKDFFNRYNAQNQLLFEIADQSLVKERLQAWGEDTAEFCMVDNRNKRNLMQGFIEPVIKNNVFPPKPPSGSKTVWYQYIRDITDCENFSCLLNFSDLCSFTKQDYAIKIVKQLIYEQDENDRFAFNTSKLSTNQLLSQFSHFNRIKNISLTSDDPYDPWPIEHINFIKKKYIHLDGYFSGEVLDLSGCTELTELNLSQVHGGIRQIVLPQQGCLNRLTICNTHHKIKIHHLALQTKLEKFELSKCAEVSFNEGDQVIFPPALKVFIWDNLAEQNKPLCFNFEACENLCLFHLQGVGVDKLKMGNLRKLRRLTLQISAFNELSFDQNKPLGTLDETTFIIDKPISPGLQDLFLKFQQQSRSIKIHTQLPTENLVLGIEASEEGPPRDNYTYFNTTNPFNNVNWKIQNLFEDLEIHTKQFIGQCDFSQSIGLKKITLYAVENLDCSKIKLPVDIESLTLLTHQTLLNFDITQFNALKYLTLKARCIKNPTTFTISKHQSGWLTIFAEEAQDLKIDLSKGKNLNCIYIAKGIQIIPEETVHDYCSATSIDEALKHYLKHPTKANNPAIPTKQRRQYHFDTNTGPVQQPLTCVLKFSCAGKPIEPKAYHLARYDVFNAVNEQHTYYLPHPEMTCVVEGLEDSAFDARKQQDKYVYGYDHLTLLPSQWIYLPNLAIRQPLSLRQNLLNLCEVAYFPDRDQYGLKLKTSQSISLDVEYCYDTENRHNLEARETIPILSDKLRAQISDYHTTLPIKNTEGIEEILAYCKNFSIDNLLNDLHPEALRPMLSQAGACQHRALACLMLCAYQGLPCRMITNDLHAFVETYDAISQCWELHDLGGAPAKIVWVKPTPAKPMPSLTTKAPSVEVEAHNLHGVSLQQTIPAATHEPQLVAPNPLDLFKSLFVNTHPLPAKATPAQLVDFLTQESHVLLRYQNPQFAWHLNQLLLNHHLTKTNQNPAPYLFISNPQQMISLFKQFKITPEGKPEPIAGPLQELILQGGTLYIDWSTMSAKETACYKSLLDDYPTLHDITVNQGAITMIHTEQVDSNKEDDSFYSRMQTIIRIPAQLETVICQMHLAKHAHAADVSTQSLVPIYLYQDSKHWQSTICGKPTIHGAKYHFESHFLNALKDKAPGIIVYGPPELSAFDDFIQTIRAKKQILINGEYHAVPDEFQIVMEPLKSLTAKDVLQCDEPADSNRVLEVNASNAATLFSHDSIDNTGYVHHHPDGLFADHDHFVVTSPLDPPMEQRLFHRIQQAKKSIRIRASITAQPLDVNTNSGVIFSADPAFTVVQQFPGSLSQFVDLKTTWSDLIEQIEVQSTVPLILKRTSSRFLEALIQGERVIFYGQMNLDLYQRLSSLFNQHNYLIINGEKIRPAGNLILITPEQSDPLYSQVMYRDTHHITLKDYKDYFLQNDKQILGSVDNSFFEAVRSAAGPHDSEILLNAQYNCTGIDRYGSREQVAGRRDLNCQQALKYVDVVNKLFLIYELAANKRIALPRCAQAMQTCLQQLTRTQSIVVQEKVIKSVLLSHYAHHSEKYACINVLAKLLFTSTAQKKHNNAWFSPNPLYTLSKKPYAKLNLRSKHLRQSPWLVANCLSGEQLMACFELPDPLQALHTLFTQDGSLSLKEDRIDQLEAFAKRINQSSHDQTSLNKQELRFNQFLKNSDVQVLILQGAPGVGKTHLVKLYQGDPYWGKDQVIHWLNSSDGLLILDEYNLEENAFWCFFENLHKGYVCYQGENYPISKQHKIVCTCNPDDYPERKTQTTLPAQAITLYFKHPDDDVVRQIIARHVGHLPALASVPTIFMTCYHVTREDHPYQVSLRDIEMLCQRFQYRKNQQSHLSHHDLAIQACVHQFIGLYPTQTQQQDIQQRWMRQLAFTMKLPQPASMSRLVAADIGMSARGYVRPPSRQFVWELVLEDIALFQTGDLSAKGGILIEGPSGIGKTRLYIEALEHLKIPYALISSGSEGVLDTLREAFHGGRAVILDELNLDPALEKLLGQYLTGVDELGQSMQVPGFFVLASQNPLGYAARKKLAPSLLNRLHRCVLPELSAADLQLIAEHKLANPSLARAFVKSFQEVQQAGLYQINTRNFFVALETFTKQPPETLGPFIQAADSLPEDPKRVITEEKLRKINQALNGYAEDRQKYYAKTWMGHFARLYNPHWVTERLAMPSKIKNALREYLNAPAPEAKENLVKAIVYAFNKFKPRHIGNYAHTLQYQLLSVLDEFPELQDTECYKAALSNQAWQRAWRQFRAVPESSSSQTTAPII